jgi:GNAT superfamily N-acetyltransferase
MDAAAVRAAYDEQVRRNARSRDDGIEREGNVVREVRTEWAGVTWSDLDEDTADAAIAAQIARFAARKGRWEWKLYSYDRPIDLPRRLHAAGLRPEPEESVLAAEIATLDLEPALPAGTEIVEVRDEPSVRALVAFQDEVFGSTRPGMAEVVLAALARQPPEAAALMAVADGEPVAAGRLELPAGGEFAGLWGGCTHPDWRGRGLFRALVARRAALAAQRGYRWLHVDAVPASRPILLRLGFIELAKTTPWIYSP